MSQPHTSSQTRLPTRTRSRSPGSRPTTPLRASSRSSFRTSQSHAFGGASPLDNFEPQFAELSDSMADLEANLMHLQLMHESLSRFAESFASFLYGLNMNAFVVDFPEAPLPESFKRFQKRQGQGDMDEQTILPNNSIDSRLGEGEASMLNADASFTSLKATPRRKTMAPSVTPSTMSTSTSTSKQSHIPGRGGMAGRASRATGRGARGSGLPRGKGRGAR
ncbi:DASH complex subunit DAM1 [Capronia coronata CBS 617.96]|uniref:DASH complex subunit DAM1 n=1 Tax=Capronia coronata CBS 617.96 TaxID=1182541 RepID=W9YZA9_9EURO|nr:DASH complex subunit DAM1 [Capronia coronata CBS 617.96]EXJ94631.1 DASH complex subunit DAM1 [Capronia coronata CBS 617.96]